MPLGLSSAAPEVVMPYGLGKLREWPMSEPAMDAYEIGLVRPGQDAG